MTLKFNKKTNEFVVISNDNDRAEAVGLTLSTSARGPHGEKVWFTPSPYAALPYFREADAAAKEKLGGLWDDYSASWATETTKTFAAPAGLAFMPFQNAGIEYALKRPHCLIGDEMGLGKTMQAIGIANEVQAEHVLVICPASIRKQWQRKIKEWSIIPRVTTYPILGSRNGVNPFANYVVISYDLIRNESLHSALFDINWDLIILDEAYFLKTTDAIRTRAVFGGGMGMFKTKILADKAKRIVALTGTPLPNRPRECYTLARALSFESIDWSSFDDFCFRFNPSGMMNSGFVKEEKGRLPELQSRLRCNFMVRRHKKNVLKDLPDMQFALSYVEPSGSIKDALSREAIIGFDITDLSEVGRQLEFGGEVSTVRREMGEAMAPAVAEYCKYLLDIVEVPKLVIFCHHKTVMDYMWSALNEYGVLEVRGGVSNNERDRRIQQFQTDPSMRVFDGQMQACGEGIDGLQHVASRMVFAEPSWVPKDNEQCAARCHRIGQHDNVIADLMVVEGSISERILATTIDKSHTIHDSLDQRHGEERRKRS